MPLEILPHIKVDGIKIVVNKKEAPLLGVVLHCVRMGANLLIGAHRS